MKVTAKDVEILARTVYGEARSESRLGKKAVAFVVLNRVARGSWWGETISQVCLWPNQFSAWLESDPNRVKMQNVDLGDAAYRECMRSTLDALAYGAIDPTHGACHYHTHAVNPKWAKGERYLSIGGHRFFSGIA